MEEKDQFGKPTVSVVMGVYNGERYLAEAVASILRQSLTEWEFLIVDDGSTDSSAQILKDFAAQDPRIRPFFNENQGLTKSLNFAIEQAQAPYIARMDGDDVAMPDRLELQVRALEADSSLVLVGAEVEQVTETGIPLGPRGHLLEHSKIRERLLLGHGGSLTHPVVMFRKDAFDAIGGYDEAFVTTQDLDLFLRLTEVGKACNLPQTLLHWRQHPQSINRTKAATWAAMRRMALQKTIKRIGVENFLNGMIPTTDKFNFPSDPLRLGDFARRRQRSVSAMRFYSRAFLSGPARLRAAKGFVVALISKLT